jgi:hypothetical protein
MKKSGKIREVFSSPGKQETSRDKYLGTDYYQGKQSGKSIISVTVSGGISAAS